MLCKQLVGSEQTAIRLKLLDLKTEVKDWNQRQIRGKSWGYLWGKSTNIQNRVALVDCVGYAFLENAYRFGQKLFCLARRHGVMSAGRVLAVGDGAGWIRRMESGISIGSCA